MVSSTPFPSIPGILRVGAKKILVDTGEMGPIQSKSSESAIGGKIYKFEQGLDRWGLKAENIDIIIHTHLHNDHCENDFKCENATIYVHEKEIEAIYNPHPLDFRYSSDFIEEVNNAGQIKQLKGDAEIVAGIRMIHTPAHTKGGMTVLVDTEKGVAAITGFCIVMENFYPPVSITAMEMEVIPPGTHINTEEAYDILLKVRGMADILLPLHEPEFASRDTIPE
ncbi:MBL fold metallo-hydrolase [Thermodesulfovibrionales bacterium]|nr:MBL fold metallo-hydrolase [Thermodesulfovibrionales bacterium]